MGSHSNMTVHKSSSWDVYNAFTRSNSGILVSFKASIESHFTSCENYRESEIIIDRIGVINV